MLHAPKCSECFCCCFATVSDPQTNTPWSDGADYVSIVSTASPVGTVTLLGSVCMMNVCVDVCLHVLCHQQSTTMQTRMRTNSRPQCPADAIIGSTSYVFTFDEPGTYFWHRSGLRRPRGVQ